MGVDENAAASLLVMEAGPVQGHDDDSLDAARGIAVGLALGTVLWLLLGLVVYLAVR